MWAEQSSASSSSLQLRNNRLKSESAIAPADESRFPGDVKVEEAVEWKPDWYSVLPSWCLTHGESGPLDLTHDSRSDQPETLCYQQCDEITSNADSLTDWLQQQLPKLSSCDDPPTWSPAPHHHKNLHQQQQQPRQPMASQVEWDKVRSQTTIYSDDQSSQVTTTNCSETVTVTTMTEEERLWSGVPSCQVTYRGQPLRYIAPKLPSGTVITTIRKLPKTRTNVDVGRPLLSPVTFTATTSMTSKQPVKRESSRNQPEKGKTV